MKTLIVFFILGLGTLYSNPVSAQGWEWASGGTGGSEGYGIAVDHWGNVYGSGFAKGTLDFSGIKLTGLGTSATIIVKYDAQGNLLWAGSTHNGVSRPINLATDDTGNLYVLGYYTSPSLDVGSFTLSNPASVNELYLAKFSPSGTVVYAMNLCAGNAPGNIVVSGGNIYITASFTSPAVTLGTFTLTNADPSGTTEDILLIKMDIAGNLLWAKSFGGSGADNSLIAITKTGSIYMTGTSASSSISFGGVGLTNTDTSMYLVKFDTACNALWAKNQKGIGKIGSFTSGITTDFFENVFIVGSWRPTAYFGAHILPADTVSDIFVVKYDATGGMQWVGEVTGNGQLYGFGITMDNCDHVWISGGMGDQTPGHHGSNYIKINGIKIDPPVGSKDPTFLSEWTNSGTYVKSALLPTAGDDFNSIGADGAGNIYISGDYWLGPFTIGHSTLHDPVQPSEDICVVKYNNNKDTTWLNTTVCMQDSVVLQAVPGYEAYMWDNGRSEPVRKVYAPGTYKLHAVGLCGSGVLVETFTVEYGKLDTVYTHTDTTACLHAHTILSAPAGYSPYLWNDGSTTQTDIIDSAGTYWVIATGTCTIPTLFDTFFVTNNNIDLSFSLGVDTDVCAPIMLTVPVTGVSYLWQDGSSANTFLATGSGLYSVRISEQACFNTDSIDVNFISLAQHLRDTILCRERPVQLILRANIPQSGNNLSIQWSTGSTQPEIAVSVPGTYWVTITDGGCTGSDTMNVGIMFCTCDASFPGAFTPNGDGKNDFFFPFIDKLCDIMDYTFGVYDRWGNMVFWTHDPAAKWDGTFNGIPQDVGVYMYFAEYRVGDVYHKHRQKGDFTLLR
jgi:gliding motility-associated-like protein